MHSSNLGDYNWSDSSVQIGVLLSTPSDLLSGESGIEENNVINYVAGLAMYPVVFIVLAVLSFLFSFCCCLRCTCRCCCEGCCGSHYPTHVNRDRHCKFLCCNSCGFTHNTDTTSFGRWGYTSKQIFFTKVMIAVFIILMCLWLIWGRADGIIMMNPALKAMTRGSDGLADVLVLLNEPFVGLALYLTSQAIVPFMISFDHLLHRTVDSNQTLVALDCLFTTSQNLPVLDVFGEWIVNVSVEINATLEVIESIFPILESLDDPMEASITQLQADLTALDGQLNVISLSLDATSANVTSLSSTLTSLKSPSTGAERIVDDVNSIPATYPSQSELSDANSQLQAPPSNGASAASLIASLSIVEQSFLAMPDYSATATVMTNFNAEIDVLSSGIYFTSIQNSIANTAAELNNLTLFSAAINQSFVAMADQTVTFAAMDSVELILRTAEEMVQNISFQVLTDEVSKLYNLNDLFPCLYVLLEQISSFNETIFAIPSEFVNITSLFGQLNSTLYPVFDMADSVNLQIEGLENSTQDIGIDAIIGDISNMTNQLLDLSTYLSQDAVLGELDNMTAQVSAVDYTILDQVSNLSSTLAANKLTDPMIQSMSDFEAYKQSLIDQVQATEWDLQLYELGYCSNDVTALCSSLSDCGGNACNGIRTRRCSRASDYSVACAQDSDCGSDRCMIDAVRFATLGGLLSASRSNLPDTSASTANMQAIIDSATIDTSGFDAAVTSSKLAIDSVSVDSSIQTLESTRAALSIFSVNDTMASFASVSDSLAIINIDSLTSSLGGLNGTYAMITETQAYITDVKSVFLTLEDLHHDYLPNVFKPVLEEAYLLAMVETQGPGAALLHISNTFDALANHVNESQKFYDTSANHTALASSTARLCDALGSTDAREAGSMFYIFNLISVLSSHSNVSLVNDSATGIMGLFTDRVIRPGDDDYDPKGRFSHDSEGNKYPDGKVCYTSDCLDNQVDFSTYAPFPEMLNETFGVKTPVTDFITMSVENTFMVPFVIPSFVILAMFMGFFVSNCASNCHNFACGLQLMAIPWILIFSGLTWFFVIIMGDLCYGGANLGYSMLSSMGPEELCPFNLSETGDCQATLAFGPTNLTVDIDVMEVYVSLLGQCPSAADDPFGAILTNVADALGTFGINYMNEFLRNSSLPLRNSTAELFLDLGRNTTSVLSEFGVQLTSPLGCPSIQGIFVSIESSICCDMMSALYWAIGCWCMMGWTMCCVGVPTSLIARKRLNLDMWGPDFDSVNNSVHSALNHKYHDTEAIELADAERRKDE